jgi:hypothetical protein
LTGLGLAAARFNPLTLDLRDPKLGEAQDSVLWLRNGGGKTTLIALLYSTLVPDKRHFLGKLLGKDSGLADFVRNNDLGVVVTEWDFPGQMGSSRRVIGQAIKSMDGETTRKFFSFVTTPDYGFDSVPVLGLKSSHPARSIEELLERLRKAADQAAGRLDLVIPLDQKEWADHLENVGLDPELFEAHLKMNKQEGGAAELFKLKSADDFLRLFLNLIVDEESTAEEEKSLEALRAKVIQTPDREAAVAFGKEVLDGLERFAAESKAVNAKRDEESSVKVAIGRFARSLGNRIADFRVQQQTETQKKEMAERDGTEHKRRRENLVRHANGYRRRALTLRIDETRVALEAATARKNSAEHHAEVMEAAVPWAKAVRSLAEKQACEAALEAARDEHRPEFDAVRALGGLADRAWATAADEARQRADTAWRSVKEAKAEQTRLQGVRAHVSGTVNTAEAEHNEAQRKLDDRKNARERLRVGGTLASDESPEAGKQRWNCELEAAVASRRKAAGEKSEAEALLGTTQTALTKALTSKESKGTELERIRTEKRQIAQEQQGIGQLQCVLDLCAGMQGDPRSEPLLRNLEDQADATQTKLVRHRIETLEDSRTERFLLQKGVAAPSQDLELALEWLEKQGVSSAMPAYEWLAEHRSEDEARELLSANPAVWSGVLVQIQEEWQKLSGMVLRLPIKAPVVISLAGNEGIQDELVNSHTVLPEEGAMFSKALAQAARAALQERRGNQELKEEELKEKLASHNHAITRIKEFRRKWPLDVWNQLLRDEAAVEDARNRFQAEAHDLATREHQLREKIQTQQQIDTGFAAKEATARQHLAQLDTFFAEHEANAQRWLDQYKETQRIAEQGRIQLSQLKTQIDGLVASEETATNDGREAGHLHSRWLTRKGQLPTEYVGPCPSDAATADPEAAEIAFRAAIAAYEGKIHKSELVGRIRQMEESRQDYLEEVRLRRGKATDEEIAAAGAAPDIESARLESHRQRAEAIAMASSAATDYQGALAAMPRPRAHGEGSDISDTDYGPTNTSAECIALVAELEERSVAAKGDEEAAQTRRYNAERTAQTLGHRIEIYELMLNQLEGATLESEPHPDFSEDDEENKHLVGQLSLRGKHLRRDIDAHLNKMHGLFERQIHDALHSSAYEHRKIEFRDRLLRLNYEDLQAAPDEHVAAVKTQVAVAQNQLDSLNQEKSLVVDQMERLASRARYWCEQASKVSTMKKDMGPWSNLPFLEIHIARRPDAVERRALLSRRVDDWFATEANIPKGADLVFGCLQALGGNRPPTIKILKPQWERDGTQHDITSLAKFSDGERLTTAILLYCVLVRLRARHRGKDTANWGKDAGMLLLDNPFGKATLAELVNLQVQTAREMGVQLIYATGINDFAALKHFGHIVRLRNSSRSRSTGDYHVTQDDRPIEVAVVGYRPPIS